MTKLLPLIAVVLLSGCASNLHFLDVKLSENPNQIIRVEPFDRYVFELEENVTTGYMWDYTCDDPDVEVHIEHISANSEDGMVGCPGKAKVFFLVHRGYDGPTTLEFFYKRRWEKAPIKSFHITLFRRTGDSACWK